MIVTPGQVWAASKRIRGLTRPTALVESPILGEMAERNLSRHHGAGGRPAPSSAASAGASAGASASYVGISSLAELSTAPLDALNWKLSIFQA